jgi:dUTP pyrophosphatase
LLVKKLHKDAVIPKYMTNGSVGFDFSAIEDYVIYNEVVKVRTGLAFEIPNGYEMNIRARSGLSLKYPNYFVISGGGTIDSDYRLEVLIPVINTTKKRWEIKKGDRIAQGIISPIIKVEFVLVNELSETDRKGGFGHTGV